jgi:hypothetical protein
MTGEHSGQAKKHLDYPPGGTSFSIRNRPEVPVAHARSVKLGEAARDRNEEPGQTANRIAELRVRKLPVERESGFTTH